MNKTITFGLIAIIGQLASAADSSSRETLAKASQDLAGKTNYSWTASTMDADGTPAKINPIDGKAEKGGVTYLSFIVGGVPVEVCMKGEKGSAKALEGWQTFDEIAQTSGTAAAVVRFLRSYKAPAPESAALIEKVKDLKEEEGAFSGELQDEATKEYVLIGTRRREGAEPPTTSDTQGSVRFWIKDGVVTKYEIKVQGKVTTAEKESTINRTTTVNIKDVGATKMDVPAEALEKMK